MEETEIIRFLKINIEPLEDNFHGEFYRASVYLKDETYLPCVIFGSPNKTVEQAIKRFKEEKDSESVFSRKTGIGYKEIVKIFTTKGNRLNHYDISKIKKSRYAFPKAIQNQISGETAMSWTAFVAKFNDGRNLNFGTRWYDFFFEIPSDYDVEISVKS